MQRIVELLRALAVLIGVLRPVTRPLPPKVQVKKPILHARKRPPSRG